jgi:hypothetical protein
MYIVVIYITQWGLQGQSGNSDKLEGIYLEFNPASEGYYSNR